MSEKRSVCATAPDGTQLEFRAPSFEEYEANQNLIGEIAQSVRARKLCVALKVQPEGDGELTRVFKSWPGLYTKGVREIEKLAGGAVEFGKSIAALNETDRKPVEAIAAKFDGIVRHAYAPDGELVVVRNPIDSAWARFQDATQLTRMERLKELALHMLVTPSGDAATALIDKYPAILGPISDEAVDLVGANIEFVAKKG